MKNIFELVCCPVCGGSLHRDNKCIICDAGHSFDIAKCGYVNMLPTGKAKNSHTGDEREMVRARVDFLSRGYYAEISRRLASLLSERLPRADGYTLCDMGCGEGYHTCAVTEAIADKTGKSVLTLGFDASKYAAECASKRSRSMGLMPRGGIGEPFEEKCAAYFMPGNIFSLPIRDSSVDVATSMFAPIAGDEASRILKKGGILAVVASGKEHLMEMREIIYDDVHISAAHTPTPDGFRELFRDSLKYTEHISSGDDIRSLFMMTPFYYRTPEQGRAVLYGMDELYVTVDINYSFFEVI